MKPLPASIYTGEVGHTRLRPRHHALRYKMYSILVDIDGADAQPSAIWGAKLYEVIKNVTLTQHIFLMSGMLVSDAWMKSMPADLQAIVTEESKRWGASALKRFIEFERNNFAVLYVA